jgi:hypothetical protein
MKMQMKSMAINMKYMSGAILHAKIYLRENKGETFGIWVLPIVPMRCFDKNHDPDTSKVYY